MAVADSEVVAQAVAKGVAARAEVAKAQVQMAGVAKTEAASEVGAKAAAAMAAVRTAMAARSCTPEAWGRLEEADNVIYQL